MASRTTPLLTLLALFGLFATAHAQIDWNTVPLVNHSTVQGVDASGNTTFSKGDFPIRVQGVVLNDYSTMLDNTANFESFDGTNLFHMGGQWQVFVQSIDPNDTAASCLWMGQNYGTAYEHMDDDYSYSNEDWNAEVQRLSWLADPNDPNPSNPTLPLLELTPGSLVEIRARAGRPYCGKFNINEDHNNLSQFDFEVVLLDPNYGLPAPMAITLDDVIDASTGDFIFDATRQTGGERYQGQLVTLQDVSVVDAGGWGPNGEITVSDGTHNFNIWLGCNGDFDTTPAPAEGTTFDITGVFDQESWDLVDGYHIWATETENFLQIWEGDVTRDGKVNAQDFAFLSSNWQYGTANWNGGAAMLDSLGKIAGDFNDDLIVNAQDFAYLMDNWQKGIETPVSVPEPSLWILLGTLLCGTGLIRTFLARRTLVG